MRRASFSGKLSQYHKHDASPCTRAILAIAPSGTTRPPIHSQAVRSRREQAHLHSDTSRTHMSLVPVSLSLRFSGGRGGSRHDAILRRTPLAVEFGPPAFHSRLPGLHRAGLSVLGFSGRPCGFSSPPSFSLRVVRTIGFTLHRRCSSVLAGGLVVWVAQSVARVPRYGGIFPRRLFRLSAGDLVCYSSKA